LTTLIRRSKRCKHLARQSVDQVVNTIAAKTEERDEPHACYGPSAGARTAPIVNLFRFC
jgi:hypothetical protein